jgi:hypothetical protein
VRCTWTTTTKSRTATTTTPLQNTIELSHIRRTFVRFCVIYISSSLELASINFREAYWHIRQPIKARSSR